MEIRHLLSKAKKPFFIIGAFLVVYVVFVVFVLPSVIKSKLPDIIQKETGRKTLITSIQAQPFPFAINFKGFEIQEHNGQSFATFDDLSLKFGLFRSIKEMALAFDKVSLIKPYVHIARQKNGTFNFQDLIKSETENKEEPGQAFPVHIAKLSLSEGKLSWEDASFTKPVKEDIHPINLEITNFATHTDNQAEWGLSLALGSGGQLDWQGTTNLKPLSSEGHIKLDNVMLETISALTLPDTMPFHLKGYELLDVNYKASYAENSLKFAIYQGMLEIHDFQFFEKGSEKSLIKIPFCNLRGIDFSLDNRTVVIDSLSSDKADIKVWLNKQGIINYQSLFKTSDPVNNNASKSAVDSDETKESPWKIKVNTLTLNSFGLNFEDQTVKNPVVIDLKPINFKLTNFNNELGVSALFQLSAGINKTGSIKLTGDTIIQPFFAKAALDVKDIALKDLQTYVAKVANIAIIDGKLNVDGNAVVDTTKKDQLGIAFKGNSGIRNLFIRDQSLKEKNKHKDLVKIPDFALRGIDFNLGNQELVLNAITANDAELQAWLNPDGVINYESLLSISKSEEKVITKTVEKTVEPQTATWKIKVSNMALTNFGLNFEDQTLKKPLAMSFKPINLKLANYSNQSGAKLPVQLSVGMNKTGLITLKGDTVIEPLSANFDIDVKNIGLEQFQPYFDKFVRLDVIDGALHVDGKVSVAKQKPDKLDVKFKGDTGIASLLTRDQTLHMDLVKWEDLTLKDFAMDLLANRYTAAALVMDKPYARVTIRKDKTVNFNDIVINDKSKSKDQLKLSQAKQTDLKRPFFKIGKVQVKEGSSDFSDLSLILPFAAPIKSLDGGASGISSEQKAKVNMALKGNVYDLSSVDVNGEISPYLGNFNVEINFEGLPMPLVTPYMVQFAGYKVEKGKMTLELKYSVVNKKLTASNRIFIDQFVLGEKVDNPNAVSLPLELAVALLKDSSGKIKIDVPITGSLEDPKFSIGSIVADALVNVLTKVVTAPFNALGSLIGSKEDMSTISFAAGSSSLSKQQQTKLDDLSKALKERQILNLEIRGAAFQEQDWPIIREDALNEQLRKRRAAEINKDADKKIREEYVELSEDDYKRLLADLFIEKFPLLAEKSFLGTPKLMNPEAGDFYEIAKQKLFTIIKPEQERLKHLALDRARVIASYVVQKGGVPNNRVFMLDPEIDPPRDNKEIFSKLSLKAN